MRRFHHESRWEVRKRDRLRVAGGTVNSGKYLGAQPLRHVVADRIFVRELRENGSSVEDLTAEDPLVECAWSHQPGVLTMGRAMFPDPGDQIAYDSGNALSSDRLEHVGLKDSKDDRRPVRGESKVRVPRQLTHSVNTTKCEV